MHLFLSVSYSFKPYIFVMYFEIRGEEFDLCSQDYFGYLGSYWFHIFLDFFHFYENDINILTGVAMNLYLAFCSVQMSAVVTIKSMSKICHFCSKWFTLSVGCVVFSVLVMSLWRPCVPLSLISESVVEGWNCEETCCPSLPPHLFSDDAQHRHPGPCVHTCPLKRNTCWEFL